MHKLIKIQLKQEMHTLKEGATMLQHRPANLPPPPIASHIKEEPTTFFYSHSNPIDNAAAAAAAAAGLIDPHSRDLHNALVAINNNVAAHNGTLTSAAVAAHTQLAKQQQQQLQQQQQQQSNTTLQNQATQQQQNATQQQQSQAATLALLNGGASNATNGSTNVNSGGITTVATLNGTSIKSTSSGRSTPNNGSVNGSGATDPAPGKLFVGGLSWQTSSEKLKEYFNMFGTVTDVLIMKDPVTQRSRGFGFITFQEPNSVDKVLQVPIHTLDGKKIDPKHATPKNRPRQANKTKKIFVGGVSQDTSADEVKAYFGQFGTVEETVMLMDQQTKRHRGFGFVTFENEDVVDRVCEIHFHTIKNKKVECKKAQPKEAVTPAATQLLQKRIMLGTLGMPMTTAPGQLLGARTAGGVTTVNSLAMLQTQQLQFPTPGAAAAAAAQQAALISHNPFQVQNAGAAAALAANPASFGKLLTTYPQAALHSVRYAPYPIPASAMNAANAFAAAQQHHHQQQQNAVAAHAAAAHHQQQQQQQHQQQHSAHTATSHATASQNSAATQAHNAAALAAATGGATHAGATAGTHPLAAAAAAQQAALVASNPLSGAANPYQSYALANVDMSSFQNVDWSSVYGMGMYV